MVEATLEYVLVLVVVGPLSYPPSSSSVPLLVSKFHE